MSNNINIRTASNGFIVDVYDEGASEGPVAPKATVALKAEEALAIVAQALGVTPAAPTEGSPTPGEGGEGTG